MLVVAVFSFSRRTTQFESRSNAALYTLSKICRMNLSKLTAQYFNKHKNTVHSTIGPLKKKKKILMLKLLCEQNT